MSNDNTAKDQAALKDSECSSLAGKYLAFALGDEEYGVEILKVQEIIGAINITKVPKAPHYILGVINLRGKIIPVVDLRLKLGMHAREFDRKTCFIVVNTVIKGNEVALGIVVDTVREVVNFAASQIQPPPDFGCSVDTSFIMGIGQVDKNVVILLDIDKALEDAAGALAGF
jgi:purine-binding chemotaxis protein CheW